MSQTDYTIAVTHKLVFNHRMPVPQAVAVMGKYAGRVQAAHMVCPVAVCAQMLVGAEDAARDAARWRVAHAQGKPRNARPDQACRS